MKILICICTYKRNKSLIDCLKSFKKTIIPSDIKISFLIIDNTISNESVNIIKKFNKKFKFKILQINEKNRGIVNARNRCLLELRKIKCDYVAFFDDDCEIDKYWFKNIKQLIKETKSNIITGPQIYKKNYSKKIKNLGELFEKKVKENKSNVSWAASNNVIIKKNIILKEKIYFDKNLNKFGIGEDQLFFLKFNKLGYNIIWSKDIKVYEKVHFHRTDGKWVIDRSYRLGVLGNYIDKKIYGTIIGFVINYLKFIYYLVYSLLSLLNFSQKNYLYKFLNFFFRSIGRFLGPFIFKKIQFYKK
jgi:GT2 family glycosyltransferase